MKKIIILFTMLFSLQSQLTAQSTNSIIQEKSDELNKRDFEEAKLLFKEMIASYDYRETYRIYDLFVEKLADVDANAPDLDDGLFIPWIKANLHLTKFESFEEVETLFIRYKEVSTTLHKENARLYSLLSRTSREQHDVIWRPLTDMIEKEAMEN